MKQLIVLGTGGVGAMALSMALLGTGVAAAADYDGQTYADAAAAIEESGGTPVVATRVGSQLPQDDALSSIHKTTRTSEIRPTMSTSCRSPMRCG